MHFTIIICNICTYCVIKIHIQPFTSVSIKKIRKVNNFFFICISFGSKLTSWISGSKKKSVTYNTYYKVDQIILDPRFSNTLVLVESGVKKYRPRLNTIQLKETVWKIKPTLNLGLFFCDFNWYVWW